MSDFPLFCEITNEAFDLNVLLEKITLSSTGAAAIFTGIVRGETARIGKETSFLVYESYKPMAEAMMTQIGNEIRAKWPSVEGIVIVQRIGKLMPKTPTVVVACTASHRDTGVFDAAKYGIDRLKEIVPVWKKEVTPQGEEWVEGNFHPDEV